MTGENFNFGMSDRTYKVKYYKNKFETKAKGFEQKNRSRLAKSITLAEIYKEIGGKDKIPEAERQRFERMFHNVAGEDGVIQEKELRKYFQNLQKAAEKSPEKVDKKTELSHHEVTAFARERGEYDSKHFEHGIFWVGDDNYEFLADKFIAAVVNVNDKKVAAEEKKEAAEKDLASRTSYDKEGNRTVQQKDGSSVTYDKNNHVIRETHSDENFKYTEFLNNGHKTKEIKEDKETKWITTFDKEGKPIKEETVSKKDDYRNTTNITYDKNGQVAKKFSTSKYNDGTSTETELYKNGKRVKLIEKSSDREGSMESFYSKRSEFEPYKEVYKDKNGNVEYSREYTYQEGNPNPVKVVTKNAKGEVESSVLYKYEKESLNPIREEQRNKDGKTTSVVEYSRKTLWQRTKATEYRPDGTVETTTYNKGKETKTEIKDSMGNLVSTREFTYNAKGKSSKTVYKDERGNITQQEEFFYDAQGRNAKTVKKDGNGKIIESRTVTYPTQDTTKSEYRNGDGVITKAFTTKHVKNGCSMYIDEFFKAGKPLCTREHVINQQGESSIVYKNERGEVITKDEFKQLRRQAESNE